MKLSQLSLACALGSAAAIPLDSLNTLDKRTTTQGFDISHYQSSVNFAGAYSSGARFVFIKATEGTSYTDPSFSSHYTAATNAGFIRSGYHFAHPDESSGATQAQFFHSNGGGWSNDGRTLPGMLDIEYNPSGNECYGLSQSAMVSWVQSFVNEYHSLTSRWPIIYTTEDWWTTCTGNSGAFSSTCPFNIARYDSSSVGSTPPGSVWSFWQNSDSYSYGGDSDLFNGPLSGVQKLATG